MLAVSALSRHLTTHDSKRNSDVNLIDLESCIDRQWSSTRCRSIFPKMSIIGEQGFAFSAAGYLCDD